VATEVLVPSVADKCTQRAEDYDLNKGLKLKLHLEVAEAHVHEFVDVREVVAGVDDDGAAPQNLRLSQEYGPCSRPA